MYAVCQERAKSNFFRYCLFAVNVWLCEVELVLTMECESLYKDLEVVFTRWKNKYTQKTVDLQAEDKTPEGLPRKECLVLAS
jgi:hypothetical protein